MPISGAASYLPTTDEFLAHWEAANTALGAGGPLVLAGGVARAALVTLRDNLAAKRTELQTKINGRETARGDLELKRAAALDRLAEFNDKVRAFFPGSKYLAALPEVPAPGAAQSKITDPLDDAANLWLTLNADPATPAAVTLVAAYTQALFAADLAALKTAYGAYHTAAQAEQLAREERNDIQDAIYAALKSYRLALPTMFAKGHAQVDSLPRLSPLPGATPQAVVLSGQWLAATSQAQLTWTASSDPNLAEYEVRFCSGANYSTDDETVIANIPASAERQLLTDTGLTASGLTASFKVYVRTTGGNERGSNTVLVTRP